jgi:hypothetical protein
LKSCFVLFNSYLTHILSGNGRSASSSWLPVGSELFEGFSWWRLNFNSIFGVSLWVGIVFVRTIFIRIIFIIFFVIWGIRIATFKLIFWFPTLLYQLVVTVYWRKFSRICRTWMSSQEVSIRWWCFSRAGETVSSIFTVKVLRSIWI